MENTENTPVNKTPELGEFIYVNGKFDSGILACKISKITPKIITTNYYKFRYPDTDGDCQIIGSDKWGPYRGKYNNLDMAELFRTQIAVRTLTGINWSKYDVLVLEKIIDMLKQ